MRDEDLNQQRVQFFGPHDLSAGYYINRVVEIVETFNKETFPNSISDILELHNAQKFIEAEIFPGSFGETRRAQLISQLKPIRSHIARYFSSVDGKNISQRVRDVDFFYHSDLVELLSRARVFERCDGPTLLAVLSETGVQVGVLLSQKKIVKAFDSDISTLLRADPANAIYILQKHLEGDSPDSLFLPSTFTADDSRDLLFRYIESENANFNQIAKIENAPTDKDSGINPKVKLAARRRRTRMTNEIFESDSGLKFAYEVRLSATQSDPSHTEIDESDGFAVIHTYSSDWLDKTTDYPSILNNFQHLFEYASTDCLLNLPAYEAHLSVIERIMTSGAKNEYRTGSNYDATDATSLLQLQLYSEYLSRQDVPLESVIAWFFSTYLEEEFDATGFVYHPSSEGDSYLQKARHLFAEMESIAGQFSSYVREGELDWDLLSITSNPVMFTDIPSLSAKKYLRPLGEEIDGLLNILFSDQSRLAYINEELNAKNAAILISTNQVVYSSLRPDQKTTVDHLIALDILTRDEDQLHFRSRALVKSLASIFIYKNSNYPHLRGAARSEIDALERKGWLEKRNSLLTSEEADYFNFLLNKVRFTNGPELRNKYLHGSQTNTDTEVTHFHTYLIVLRSIVALVIKINDDFLMAERP